MFFNHISKVFIGGLFMLMPLAASAQTNTAAVKSATPKPIKYPHLYWGFGVGMNMMEVKASNADVVLSNQLNPMGGIFFEVRVAKWLGIETGANYLMFRGDGALAGDAYEQTVTGLTDSDGDTYNSTYKATRVEENWNANYLEIPLSLKLQLMAGQWAFYLKPGASYNLLTGSSYKQTGVYSRSAYYPAYNSNFSAFPDYGFYSDKGMSSSGKPAFTDFINPFVGFGIVFPAKRGNLFLEARFYPGSPSMVEAGNGTLFEGPADMAPLTTDYSFESLTEEGKDVTSGGLVFNIGFRF